LETWTHEIVTRAGLGKEGEMDIKEGKINNEGDYDKSNGPRNEVLPEVILTMKRVRRE
jgi:hypothetical protein